MSRNWQQILVEGDKGDLISGLDGLEADVASGSGGSDPVIVIASSGAALTLAPSAETGETYDITLTENCAFTIDTGAAVSEMVCVLKLILRQDATGSRTVSWPGNVQFPNQTLPTLSTGSGNFDVASLVSVDGGDTWFGQPVGMNYRTAAAPSAPTGLSPTPGDGDVVLAWSAVSAYPTVSSYNLYRGIVSGGETLYKTGLTGTSYTDTDVTNGTTYYYKLSAVNSVGEGLLSGEVSATPTSSSPFVQTLGRLHSSVNTTNPAVPISASMAAGDQIIVAVRTGAGSALTTVTDSRGNTYTKDAESALTGAVAHVFSCLNPTAALQNGDTVTVGINNSACDIVIAEYGGLTVRDQTGVANNTDTGSTGGTVTAGGATAQADEVAILALNAATLAQPTIISYSTGWTERARGTTNSSDAGFCALADAKLTAITTPSVTFSWSGGSNWAAALATYKT